MAAAHQRHDVRRAPTVHVKQRHRVEVDQAVPVGEPRGRVKCVEIQVSMRQHHAFGMGGGAAGVKKFRDGVLVNPPEINRSGFGGRDQLIVEFGVRPGGFRVA